MWTTILIWIAKFLLNYFLQTSGELKVTLQSAVDVTEKLRQDIAIQKTINTHNDLMLSTMKKTAEIIEKDIRAMQEKNDKLKEEYKASVDSMPDAEVVRSEL